MMLANYARLDLFLDDFRNCEIRCESVQLTLSERVVQVQEDTQFLRAVAQCVPFSSDAMEGEQGLRSQTTVAITPFLG